MQIASITLAAALLVAQASAAAIVARETAVSIPSTTTAPDGPTSTAVANVARDAQTAVTYSYSPAPTFTPTDGTTVVCPTENASNRAEVKGLQDAITDLKNHGGEEVVLTRDSSVIACEAGSQIWILGNQEGDQKTTRADIAAAAQTIIGLDFCYKGLVTFDPWGIYPDLDDSTTHVGGTVKTDLFSLIIMKNEDNEGHCGS